MKNFIAAAVFLVLSAVVPAVPVMLDKSAGSDIVAHNSGNDEAAADDASPETDKSSENSISDAPYKVLNSSTGKITEVSVKDYVIGAVASEMPAVFEPEALKAQAVVCHTYAERQRELQKQYPDEALGNADFSDDPNKYQGFFTNDTIRHYFGDNYELHYKKIADAVDEVLDCLIVYDGEPIISAFHSMSSGMTESAENAWGTAVDYLVPTDSKSDIDAPNYVNEARISADFVKARLERLFTGAVLDSEPEDWIKIGERSESGTVLSADIGGITVTGNDLREAFGLRSADIEVEYSEGEFVFTTRGYGHGVGMSQYGANSMAQDGKTWRDIIEHYYNGIEIKGTPSS